MVLANFVTIIVGLFVVLELIDNSAYCLDLFLHAVVRDVQNVFHILLLHDWLSNRVSVVYYVMMVIYDDLKYGTLHGNLSKKMIYYDGPFLACNTSGGIYGQIDVFTVLIYHALSLKLSS